MYAEVEKIEQLSPDLLRITFSGGTLDRFEGSEATDADFVVHGDVNRWTRSEYYV